jgi:hypothetical protein
MDPISLIVTALVQGAAKAATDVVPDAYKGLRELLRKRFAGKPAAELVLEEHAADPQTYEADPEVLALARQLLEQLGAPAGSPAIEIGRGAKGIIGHTVSNATIVGDIH